MFFSYFSKGGRGEDQKEEEEKTDQAAPAAAAASGPPPVLDKPAASSSSLLDRRLHHLQPHLDAWMRGGRDEMEPPSSGSSAQTPSSPPPPASSSSPLQTVLVRRLVAWLLTPLGAHLDDPSSLRVLSQLPLAADFDAQVFGRLKRGRFAVAYTLHWLNSRLCIEWPWTLRQLLLFFPRPLCQAFVEAALLLMKGVPASRSQAQFQSARLVAIQRLFEAAAPSPDTLTEQTLAKADKEAPPLSLSLEPSLVTVPRARTEALLMDLVKEASQNLWCSTQTKNPQPVPKPDVAWLLQQHWTACIPPSTFFRSEASFAVLVRFLALLARPTLWVSSEWADTHWASEVHTTRQWLLHHAQETTPCGCGCTHKRN